VSPAGFRSGRKVRARRSGAFPVLDIEASVYEHILVVSHVWPGITPMNVWDMAYDFWCHFASAAEEWRTAREKEAENV